MEYQFSIDQNDYKINIQLNSKGFYTAKIADETFEFEAIPISGDQWLLMLGDTSVSVCVAESENNAVVSVRGQQFNVITAPMPGRILKIMVSEKQSVKAYQPLFIVESMKMENEVQSPKAGKVVKINFKENDLVSVGDAVVELDD
jgi:biotin carboxyl carrier protein